MSQIKTTDVEALQKDIHTLHEFLAKALQHNKVSKGVLPRLFESLQTISKTAAMLGIHSVALSVGYWNDHLESGYLGKEVTTQSENVALVAEINVLSGCIDAISTFLLTYGLDQEQIEVILAQLPEDKQFSPEVKEALLEEASLFAAAFTVAMEEEAELMEEDNTLSFPPEAETTTEKAEEIILPAEASEKTTLVEAEDDISFPNEAETRLNRVEEIALPETAIVEDSDVFTEDGITFPDEILEETEDVLTFPAKETIKEDPEEFAELLEQDTAFPDESSESKKASEDHATDEEFFFEDTSLEESGVEEFPEPISSDQASEVLDIDMDSFDFDALAGSDPSAAEGDGGMLSLLRIELEEMEPQLVTLAESITSDHEAATFYKETVGRIHDASKDLGLDGLIFICEFVCKNITISLEAEFDQRAAQTVVLVGWVKVLITHLKAPKDDEMILSVVSYLEREEWVEPLQYSEVRAVIDGLTKELEISGEIAVEAREKVATAEDVSLEISSDASQSVLEAFLQEAPQQAEDLSRHVANLCQGEAIKENTKAAQRISHTLKGAANLFGAKGIATLSHHLEDIFEYLVQKEVSPPKDLANSMQEAVDTIEVMVETVQGTSPAPQDAQRILQDILDWANLIDQGLLSEMSTLEAKQEELGEQKETDHKTAALVQEAPVEMLRVSRDSIDTIFGVVAETSIALSQIQERIRNLLDSGEEIRRQDGVLQTRRFELENLVSIQGMAAQQNTQLRIASTEEQNFDSLEMDEYGEFYTATHSFIEAVSDSRAAMKSVSEELKVMDSLFLQQQRLNHLLQDLVISTRLKLVKTISPRLQRAVRQASRMTDKEAELTIKGEDLLMDGDMLDKLADPIMHMLRNAVDHGIELPEERSASGKPNFGRIMLDFRREANSIVIHCYDDGKGLDYDRIRETAIERNILEENETLDHEELARLIMHPGFSTRTSEEATQVSGRGVGMDVVYTEVVNLKGTLLISDNPTGGTLFTLRLPITLLTTHSILVRAGQQKFAIPTIGLTQVLPPGSGQFNAMGDKTTWQMGRDVYSATSLSALLGIPDDESVNTEQATVLLVRMDNKIAALAVDYVISSHDFVVKPLGRYVRYINGIVGVSLLGDGSVVPVLDVAELAREGGSSKETSSMPVPSTRQSRQSTALPNVLIVDDSLSVRDTLSQLVSDAGYKVTTALDGLDAITAIEKNKPDLILTDLEMPRMTGLELATQVKANEETQVIPIIMVTSRTAQKHRDLAKKAGIGVYLTKPYSENELMDCVHSSFQNTQNK